MSNKVSKSNKIYPIKKKKSRLVKQPLFFIILQMVLYVIAIGLHLPPYLSNLAD